MTWSDSITFSPASDVLWRDVPFDHRAELSVFGVRVVVDSNAAYVTELALESFGAPDDVGGFSDDSLDDPRPPLRLRVIVEPTRVAQFADAPQWRVPDPDHTVCRAPGMMGVLDLAAGDGIVYVEEAYARERAQFEQGVLRGSILTLVTRRDRHPIHAAALRDGDAGLLLMGPSGIGKSTTCYVASRAGIDILSDDAIRVQQSPEFRVWGAPGRVLLLADAATQFASATSGAEVRITPNGKVKHVMSLSDERGTQPFVRRARLCVLRRGEGRVTCTPASADEIRDAILSAPEIHSDFFAQGRLPAVSALAASGGWILTLSANAEETVPHLKALLAQV